MKKWISIPRQGTHGLLGAAVLGIGLLLTACGTSAPEPLLAPTSSAPDAAQAADQEEPAVAEEQNAQSVAGETLLPTATPSPDSDSDSDPAPSGSANQAPSVPGFDPEQDTLALELVASGLDRPLLATQAGDGSGRMFVVEKVGTIRILRDGEILPTPFLDIGDRVGSSGSEQGLLGLAFAPDYAQSGYFFVNYTDQNGDTRIARFQVRPDDPDQADPTSEFAVLQLAQPARNHNGGMVLFGPDGYLWIGTGDGGASGDRFDNGQNPATLLGKMLRIDVTSDPSVPYQIPPSNPWIEVDWNGTDVRDEIWAVGLRNPWRYSFDRATGALWIADVGQNQYEEVNYIQPGYNAEAQGGLNFGWPILEGTHCYRDPGGCDGEGLVKPVFEYDHGGGHCSVTGGYTYRGSAYPQLDGVYFFGDYCSGAIWATMADGNGGWTTAQILSSGLTLSSFGEDEAGELYVTDLNAGTLHRLTVDK